MDFPALLRQFRASAKQSQSALALASGVAQKQISRLENGLSTPQRATIEKLGAGLQLSRDQIDQLLTAAGYTGAQVPMSSDDMHAVMAAANRLMAGHAPYPAMLVDTAQNLISSNAAFDTLLAHVPAARSERNMLRLTLREDGFFHFMREPHVLIPAYLARVQRDSAGDLAADELLREVRAWPHIASCLRRARSAAEPDRVFTAERYDLGGQPIDLLCLVVRVGAPEVSAAERLRVELFYPADAGTEGFFSTGAQTSAKAR